MPNDKIEKHNEGGELHKETFKIALYDAITPDYERMKGEGLPWEEIRKHLLSVIDKMVNDAIEVALAREIPQRRLVLKGEFEEKVKIALKEINAQTDDERAEMLETLRLLKEQNPPAKPE